MLNHGLRVSKFVIAGIQMEMMVNVEQEPQLHSVLPLENSLKNIGMTQIIDLVGVYRMSWKLSVPGYSPRWLRTMSLCYEWYADGDGGQCGGVLAVDFVPMPIPGQPTTEMIQIPVGEDVVCPGGYTSDHMDKANRIS